MDALTAAFTKFWSPGNEFEELPYFLKATLGWAIAWACLLCWPPGRTSQLSIIRCSIVHAVVCVLLAVVTIVKDWDTRFCSACSVGFFLADSVNMVATDLASKREAGKLRKPGEKEARRSTMRKVEYLHHFLAIAYGFYITFYQKYSCGPDMPIKNLYTYAQTNECSTPFYGLFRLSKKREHAMLFAASFFLARIVFNLATVVPAGLRHCSFIGNCLVTIPYLTLQGGWMILILKKGAGMSKKPVDPVPVAEKEPLTRAPDACNGSSANGSSAANGHGNGHTANGYANGSANGVGAGCGAAIANGAANGAANGSGSSSRRRRKGD